MQVYYCRHKCCKVKIQEYINNKNPTSFYNNYGKAGVFIYDPKKDKVLLVQSRGRLWGPPKGTLKEDENILECAIREVKEETGLKVRSDNLKLYINVHRATYYYLEMDSSELDIQQNNDEDANDANGITWIKISCLYNAIEDGNIVLNHHARIAFEYFIHKKFPKYNWITVKHH